MEVVEGVVMPAAGIQELPATPTTEMFTNACGKAAVKQSSL
jgi:hypothetical protein